MKTFIVNQVHSKRAVEREGLEPRETLKKIGIYESEEEAVSAYKSTQIGTEVDKELLVDDDGFVLTILTTYND